MKKVKTTISIIALSAALLSEPAHAISVDVKGFFKDPFGHTKTFFQDAGHEIVKTGQTVAGRISSFANTAKDFGAHIFQGVTSNIEKAGSTFGKGFLTFWNSAGTQNLVNTAMGSGSQLLGNALSGVMGGMRGGMMGGGGGMMGGGMPPGGGSMGGGMMGGPAQGPAGGAPQEAGPPPKPTPMGPPTCIINTTDSSKIAFYPLTQSLAEAYDTNGNLVGKATMNPPTMDGNPGYSMKCPSVTLISSGGQASIPLAQMPPQQGGPMGPQQPMAGGGM